MIYGGHALSRLLSPLSAIPTCSKGIQDITFSLAAGNLESCQYSQTTTFGAEVWVLCLDLLPFLFQCFDMIARFKIRIFLLLNGLSFWTVKIHLPQAAGYEAPVIRLHPFLSLGLLDLVVKSYIRSMKRKHCTDSWSFRPIVIPRYYIIRNIYNERI